MTDNVKLEWNPTEDMQCWGCDLAGEVLVYVPAPELVGAFCEVCFKVFMQKLLRLKIITCAQLEAAEDRFLRSLPEEEQIQRRALLFARCTGKQVSTRHGP